MKFLILGEGYTKGSAHGIFRLSLLIGLMIIVPFSYPSPIENVMLCEQKVWTFTGYFTIFPGNLDC